MPQTVKIFLASSAELKDDREQFEQFIGRKNKTLNEKGHFLKLEIWEDFIDAMSKTRLQEEYNKVVRECDIFVMLFATKVGRYTREEFEAAFGQFQASGKPRIYTYFKTAKVDLGKIPREDVKSLWDFQDRLKALGHFQTGYEDGNDLINHFNHQLELRDPFADGALPPPPPPREEIIKKYWQQLIQDPDYNSMAVIGRRERQRLENLYVRLRVTAHGDKTGVAERFHRRKAEKAGLEEMASHDLSPEAAINEFQRFVVLGPPGMGKTTLLRFIAYTVSRLGLGLARSEEFSLTKKTLPVPLYLPLTELSDEGGDLLGCLRNYLHKRFPGCKAMTAELETLLKNGQCLVLLDSLDEVAAAAAREREHQRLFAQRRLAGQPRAVELPRRQLAKRRHQSRFSRGAADRGIGRGGDRRIPAPLVRPGKQRRGPGAERKNLPDLALESPGHQPFFAVAHRLALTKRAIAGAPGGALRQMHRGPARGKTQARA